MKKTINQKLSKVASGPTVTLHELFSASPDIAKITKTSSTKSQSAMKKIVIGTSTIILSITLIYFSKGDVPDRGGRPKDRRDPNMPVFKNRDVDHEPQVPSLLLVITFNANSDT